MTLTPSSFDNSFLPADNSLLKRPGDDIQEKIIALILFACAFVSVATTIGIVAIIFSETWGFFQEVSFAQFFLDTRTVVYGYFALLVVTPTLRNLFPVEIFNALSAGLMMGIMITPTVGSISLDAIRAVPRSLREGSYALGITKLETIFKVVLPAALSGIMASIILGMSRAVGETMTVLIAAGSQPRLTLNPFESIATMTAFMAEISGGDAPRGSLSFKTLYAVGAVLFLITLVLNLASYWISHRFKEKYD